MKNEFEGVVTLAAQAGVRYSIENPLAYVHTNMLDGLYLRDADIRKFSHLVYASSSSVYGANKTIPFSIMIM